VSHLLSNAAAGFLLLGVAMGRFGPGIALLLLLGFINAAHHYFLLGPLWYKLWAITGVLLLVAFIFWLIAIGRGRQEARQGYTTSPTGTMILGKELRPVDGHPELDFVDGKTGYLIRHSHTLPLNREVYQGRLAQIRSAHPGATPERLDVLA